MSHSASKHSFLRGVARLVDLGGHLQPRRPKIESRLVASDWIAVEEDIRAGSAQVAAKEWTLSMAEELGRRRRARETRDLLHRISLEYLGLAAGAAIVAVLGYAAWSLARRGFDWPAIAVLFAAVAVPAAAFVYEHGRNSGR